MKSTSNSAAKPVSSSNTAAQFGAWMRSPVGQAQTLAALQRLAPRPPRFKPRLARRGLLG